LDEHDQKALYKVLLDEVVPTYYKDKDKWVQMMKQSVLTTYKQFAVKRMLDEYYQKLYME
jgi:starch phosphorylase